MEALLEAHGVSVIWHLDTPTGDGQIFGAQGAGALLTYPDTVKWWIYPEGSFLFLDGGTLDLGIVRDSTLNLTNDFQVFFETFEQMAWLGLESLAIASILCPNGATGGPATLIDCTPRRLGRGGRPADELHDVRPTGADRRAPPVPYPFGILSVSRELTQEERAAMGVIVMPYPPDVPFGFDPCATGTFREKEIGLRLGSPLFPASPRTRR